MRPSLTPPVDRVFAIVICLAATTLLGLGCGDGVGTPERGQFCGTGEKRLSEITYLRKTKAGTTLRIDFAEYKSECVVNKSEVLDGVEGLGWHYAIMPPHDYRRLWASLEALDMFRVTGDHGDTQDDMAVFAFAKGDRVNFFTIASREIRSGTVYEQMCATILAATNGLPFQEEYRP